jgi:hypothetical protein
MTMAATAHTATRKDDSRHAPGEGALPLWNESFWFPFYDPGTEIGVIFRVGVLPNQKSANLYLFITRRGAVVHSLVDHALPLPASQPTRLALASGLSMEWVPLERFHLRYTHAAHGFDVEWEGLGPSFLYPYPPESTAEQYPRHIEHAGTVKGTVTVGGRAQKVDCLAHRDHSWGGERDWAKMYHWDYLSAEFGRDLWFNAVRIKLSPDMDFIHLGCLWDGTELHALRDQTLVPRTADGGRRQTGVEARFTDERDRAWRIVGEEVLVNCPVQFGRTWLKDGITRFRCGDRVGWGIHELGYVEEEAG